MNSEVIKKIAVATGLLSLAFMFFGSLIYEARLWTAFVRGIEGFAVFGLLTWLVLRAWAALQREQEPGEDGDKNKGVNLDQTA